MNNSMHFAGKLGLIAALTAALAGCVTHVHNPERTVYVPAPAPEAYTPPPESEPAPVVVQPAPVVIQAPAPVVIQAPSPVVEIPTVIHNEAEFNAPLSPYGEWIVVRGYGRVWRPRHVDVSWRPYSVGRWEWTEAGWYWVSEEPWGWATYHYGRWDFTPEYGWIWAPQTQWAPAWVTWREGAGYIGWAPLPPTAYIAVNGSLEIRVAIAPARFCFVETPRMLHPIRPTTVIVNNTTIVNKTVIVNKVKVVNKVVINEGPRTDNIERATGKRLQRNLVSEVRRRDEEESRERRGRNHVTGEVHTPSRNNTTPRNEREAELEGNRHANPATPAVPAPFVASPPAVSQPQAPEPVRTHPKRTDREVELGGNRPEHPEHPEHPAHPATPSAPPQVVTAPPPVVAQPQAPEPVRNNPTRPEKQAPQHGKVKPEKAEPPVALNNTYAPQPAVEPPVRQTPRRGGGKPEKTQGQPGESAPVQPTAHIQPTPAPVVIPVAATAEPKEVRNPRNPRETHPAVTPPQVHPQVKAPAPQTGHGQAVTEIKSPKEDSSKKDKEKANDKGKEKNDDKDKDQGKQRGRN